MSDATKKPGMSGNTYASPPCFQHELDHIHGGLAREPHGIQASDVARWRKAERRRLLENRARLSIAARTAAATAIAGHLDELIGDVSGRVVSAYWPIKSELDLRPWMTTLTARGATAVLPVVVQKAAPLEFRAWVTGCRMERGVWNIPVPAEGDWLIPDVLIAPVVGFDPGCFRLGYGGGYFDRTLAAINRPVRAIGIGLSASRVDTIYPQPHDIPMSCIVTETGIAEIRVAR
jgi:5,10-methenyltetrahydrofolate synthetase